MTLLKRKGGNYDAGLLARKIEYRLTWAAIIVAIILILPGLIIGSMVVSFYGWLLEYFFRIGGDRWIFFLEWIDNVILPWFPALIRGMIGGGILDCYYTKDI